MREEKEKLVQELTRVKDKYRTSEVERSRLQTQVCVLLVTACCSLHVRMQEVVKF